MCEDRHSWLHQKQDGQRVEYQPSGAEIDEAITAQRAMRQLIHTADFRRLTPDEQKSLSVFSFGSSGLMLAPAISSRVLSCLTDPRDFLSLFSQETIGAGSIVFPVDNSELEGVGWACEFDCDGPGASIAPPGQMEIKAESLRARICATQDILQDSSMNVEGWLINKASRAFRRKIAQAVLCGDGAGKPQGVLHPSAAIQICDTSADTAAGQFTWQDLIALKFQLDEQFAARGTYLMNGATLALTMSMTDAIGRPVWMQTPASDAGGFGGFQIACSPVPRREPDA